MMEAEAFGAMVISLNEALAALEGMVDETGERVLRAAQAAASAIALMAESLLGPDDTDEEDSLLSPAPNTDDPETCGHNPPHFNLPGQTMCQTCGASRGEDGSWEVL